MIITLLKIFGNKSLTFLKEICNCCEKQSILMGRLQKKVGLFLSDFLSLGISQTLANQLHRYGVVHPTPIQEQAIPLVMDGKDLIA